MRRLSSLLLFLLLVSSLPAHQDLASNSIGQQRGSYGQDSEYRLTLDGESSILFHLEAPVWEKTERQEGSALIVSTHTFSDDSVKTEHYLDNRLISEAEGNTTRYFYYEDSGILGKTTVVEDGLLLEMELYAYDAITKGLSGILTITKTGTSISYFDSSSSKSWFSYLKDGQFEKVLQVTPNLQAKEVWNRDTLLESVRIAYLPQGGLELTTERNGQEVREVYDEHGLLISRISPSLTTGYRYNDERVLVEESEEDLKGSRRVSVYVEGRRVQEKLYRDTNLEKETRFFEDKGKVETLYDNNLPYCDITYALDGNRVLSIRYR